MDLETVRFKTIDGIFQKELSGAKPNTHRVVDFNDERFRALAKMALGYEPMGYIQICHAEKKGINFIRRIRDVTFFGEGVTVSWGVIKVI